MKWTPRKAAFAAAMVVSVCGAALNQARADVLLNNGQTVNLVPQATAPITGTPLGTITGQASLGNSPVNATINEAVYQSNVVGFGTLFAFQLTNTGTSAISTLTVTNYDNYTVLVGAVPTAPTGFPGGANGTTTPTRATRSVLGNSLTFIFDTPLAVGATSSVFFAHTNAPSFNALGAGLLTGTTAAGDNIGGDVFVNLLQPTGVAIPEPGPMALAACAGAVFGAVSWARRRAKA